MPTGGAGGMMRQMVRAVLIAVLALLPFPPGASAAAPSLTTVTQSGGKVSAKWTLPPAGQVWTIEVSKTSAVDSDGYFLTTDVVDTEIFVDTRTSWTSDVVLPAGTYYVHVSGADPGCATCPVPEWSTVKTVVVGGASSSGSGSGSTSSGSGGTTSSGPATGSTGSTGSNGSTGDAPSSGSTGGTTDAPSTPVAAPAAAYGTVSKATARLKGSLATIGFSVCGSGDVDVTVTVARGKATHVAVVTLPLAGCTSY